MAVKPITNKSVVASSNIKREEQTTLKNVKADEDVYGERKHSYIPDSNGNLKMEELMGKMLNKLDNIPGSSQTGTKAIEVDIKREIAIGKVDASAVKSEEYKGKVNNKLDKLKALRRRNGR